ncbi:ATP-binding protein [Belliella kenyensis]|uniref:ATP-binding protein n=1 Tax=Belliella kenyensis TaxID=1472724 RepID=A0ABV8ERA0_9BACT|nr:ATP-binding protein [Belliella kenyensis]MCH7402573.1 ATP-binding protein [Belliella kenyensis]MDN3603371.1 ATP-binding protein [Belliella kenyensis]
MFITRQIQHRITHKLQDEKAVIIFGPRQVGKSTLLKNHRDQFKSPIHWWNGDDADIREMLSNPSSTKLKTLIGNAKTIVIDEAQRIQNIGICIKIIVDNFPDVKVLATGSSAFELSNSIREPLTGRKWEYYLFPFSFAEMVNHSSFIEEKRMITHRMIYGYYPEIVLNPNDAEDRLKMISDSYLFKDVFALSNLRKPDQILKLLQALAYQVGSEVSYNELGMITGLDNETVEKYITLMEQTFIIFRVGSYSRNLRNELKKAKKIYFIDNGIRNSLINNFVPLENRTDVGALWENFLMSERLKKNALSGKYNIGYFWRTHAQQEIDYIEDNFGQISAWEFKWNPKSKTRIPITFQNAYPEASIEIIHKENFETFIS